MVGMYVGKPLSPEANAVCVLCTVEPRLAYALLHMRYSTHTHTHTHTNVKGISVVGRGSVVAD